MLVLKDVLDMVQNLVLQGGEEFQPDKYLTDRNFVIQVMSMTYYVDLVTY